MDARPRRRRPRQFVQRPAALCQHEAGRETAVLLLQRCGLGLGGHAVGLDDRGAALAAACDACSLRVADEGGARLAGGLAGGSSTRRGGASPGAGSSVRADGAERSLAHCQCSHAPSGYGTFTASACHWRAAANARRVWPGGSLNPAHQICGGVPLIECRVSE
ncbi:hypothetical protein T492DRAFT_940480 [Pavlovales sp. CCMP2436]|nr:hypothetical protein T492DRAFT_940480 [Pavlovales sp. CCMP2436]